MPNKSDKRGIDNLTNEVQVQFATFGRDHSYAVEIITSDGDGPLKPFPPPTMSASDDAAMDISNLEVEGRRERHTRLRKTAEGMRKKREAERDAETLQELDEMGIESERDRRARNRRSDDDQANQPRNPPPAVKANGIGKAREAEGPRWYESMLNLLPASPQPPRVTLASPELPQPTAQSMFYERASDTDSEDDEPVRRMETDVEARERIRFMGQLKELSEEQKRRESGAAVGRVPRPAAPSPGTLNQPICLD